MKALLALLGGGSTIAAAAVAPPMALLLGLLIVGVLGLTAGVVFHSSREPAERVERLIKAWRPTMIDPAEEATTASSAPQVSIDQPAGQGEPSVKAPG